MTAAPRAVHLTAKDGLPVRADHYPARGTVRAQLVLCHRSHFHRGEYAETAPWLAERGFASLAVDLRSGMDVLGRRNETAAARARG